jgi:hypothetical protein
VKAMQGMKYQSIQCPHVGTADGKRYPLWVISYWVKLIPICRICQKWVKADESLQKQSKPHHRIPASDPGLIHNIYNALSCMPWGRNIRGFSTSVGTKYLATYATTEWLSDEHITQMLDLLRCDVIREGLSLSIEVESIWFIPKLMEGYGDQEKYTSHASYHWICRQGQAFGTGAHEQLALIGNVCKNHWITLVMDFMQGTVFYGDSLGKDISNNLQEVLDWWIHLHTGRHFDYSNLPHHSSIRWLLLWAPCMACISSLPFQRKTHLGQPFLCGSRMLEGSCSCCREAP